MTAVDLRPGVIRYESALWETTALALHAGGEAVLVDPCVSAPEIADQRLRNFTIVGLDLKLLGRTLQDHLAIDPSTDRLVIHRCAANGWNLCI